MTLFFRQKEKGLKVMRHLFSSKSFALPATVLTALLLAACLSGCGDDAVSNNGSSIAIAYVQVFSSGSADIGASMTVEAQVTDQSGAPLSGQLVVFSVTPSSLGYFTPASDTSDADGKVAVLFTATSAGIATLSAASGDAAKSASLTIVGESSSSSGLITVDVTPQILLANGSDEATVNVTASDYEGNTVPDGTVIFLTAGERFEDVDQDGYWTNNVDSLLFDANANDAWDPIGTIQARATTTNGVATATYRAGNQSTTVYIRATLALNGSVDYAESAVKLTPNTSVASISITHDFEDLRVRGVGGIEWTAVTATAYDEFGNRVPEGIPIDFTIAAGPNGGENIQGQGYGPVTVSTDQTGDAQVTVNSGTIPGTIKLRATSGSVVSAVTQLVINAGPPAHITVGVGECNIRSWDRVNESNDISVNVVDIWGNPVPDSTVVWFSTEEGFAIAHDLTGIGHPKGIAASTWYSGNPRNDGIVYIYACTDGGEYGQICDTVAFISSGPAYYVNVTEYPDSLVADGEDKGKVVVQVLDENGNFMVRGTDTKFEADLGTIAGGGTENGCYFSIFETYYYSEVLDRDYSPVSPDDGIGALTTVSVVVGGMGGPQSVFHTYFLTGNTYVKNSTVDIESEIEPGTTVPFTITIKDRPGNPLGGHSLTISPSIGTVSQSEVITDEYGEANLFYTAPGMVGTCVITVTDNDPRGSVSFAEKINIKYAE
jgi:hypothetical protein